MKHILLPLLLLIISSTPSHSKQYYGDISNVKYVSCYDGDTCTVTLPGLHPLIGNKIPVRIVGYDSPEIRGKCSKEKLLAHEAKRFINSLLASAHRIDLKNTFRPKFFRIGANLHINGIDVASIMIKQGYAVAYDGNKRTTDWCNTPLTGKFRTRYNNIISVISYFF